MIGAGKKYGLLEWAGRWCEWVAERIVEYEMVRCVKGR